MQTVCVGTGTLAVMYPYSDVLVLAVASLAGSLGDIGSVRLAQVEHLVWYTFGPMASFTFHLLRDSSKREIIGGTVLPWG